MLNAIRDWFGKQGWSPFDFQRETWRAYAEGRSGLVHAPTGVGKTYAVWLGPVMERLAAGGVCQRPAEMSSNRRRREKCDPLTVLWLTPLRALAADTGESLRAPIDDLGIPSTPWSEPPP